jgi:hypothetical protein
MYCEGIAAGFSSSSWAAVASARMASTARRLVQQVLGPQLTRGFRTSGAAKGAPAPKTGGGLSHEEIVLGDGHHGFRPGYNYVGVGSKPCFSSRSSSTQVLDEPFLCRASAGLGARTKLPASRHGRSRAGLFSNALQNAEGQRLQPALRCQASFETCNLCPCSQIPNFHQKYAIGMPLFFATAIGIPAFAVWWQQSKLKTS